MPPESVLILYSKISHWQMFFFEEPALLRKGSRMRSLFNIRLFPAGTKMGVSLIGFRQYTGISFSVLHQQSPLSVATCSSAKADSSRWIGSSGSLLHRLRHCLPCIPISKRLRHNLCHIPVTLLSRQYIMHRAFART